MGLKDWFKDKMEEVEIKRQARKEAMQELRPELKNLIKEQELKKMKENAGKSWVDKLGKEFNETFTKERIDKVLGDNLNNDSIGKMHDRTKDAYLHKDENYAGSKIKRML
jgi:hypothetical protein